ncbi:MAG: carboxypeptidase regulatory-like domain-containing protein, partial [Anaerolineae bacterium]
MVLKRMLLFVGIGVFLIAILSLVWKVRVVSGMVLDGNGHPLPGAVVRVKTTTVETQTDANGRFTLPLAAPAFKTHVTAWQDGYYVAGVEVWPWSRAPEIRLSSYAVPDNAEYEWIAPVVDGRSPTE